MAAERRWRCPVPWLRPMTGWCAHPARRRRARRESARPGLCTWATCELTTPHFVADEVRKQGVPCRHILSWDDYDRLRRVPAGFPESFAEHIGRPLTAVPDPCGGHENWAEHFKEPLRESLAWLDVLVTEISQTQMYTSG